MYTSGNTYANTFCMVIYEYTSAGARGRAWNTPTPPMDHLKPTSEVCRRYAIQVDLARWRQWGSGKTVAQQLVKRPEASICNVEFVFAFFLGWVLDLLG